MKKLNIFVVNLFLITSLNSALSYAGTYSNVAANYFQISQYNQAQGDYYAILAQGTSAYNFNIWSFAKSGYNYAKAGYNYANYQYIYEDSSPNCYYARLYAYKAQYHAFYTQYYMYYIYIGYNYVTQAATNNYYASYYGSLANKYLFYCG